MEMIQQELWERCVAFHGHACPGLAIGYRAALYAAELLELANDYLSYHKKKTTCARC